MIDILMPRLSDTMEEGAILAWHKRPGDTVEVGDLLVEIETDKAVMEYEAYEAGTLQQVLVAEGDLVDIGTVIARIDDGADGPDRVASGGERPTDAPASGDRVPAAGDDGSSRPEPVPPMHSPTDTDDGHTPGAGTAERLLATPLVRRVAREHSIDLREVTGSGPGGRIVRADLDGTIARQSTTATAVDNATGPIRAADTGTRTDARGATVIPFDSVRQTISRRLTESSNAAPHFSVTAVADVEELLGLRTTVNTQLSSGAGNAKVTITDLIVRATAIALRTHPLVNVSYMAEGRGQITVHDRINIGLAMASDAGLVVPVIADADVKTVSRIATESRQLAERANDRRLTTADLASGTFTISNLGMYGVEQFTAIINPPESAILAVGTVIAEPVVVDGAIEVRHRMRLTLSADHRVIDGALAAQFLATLTGLLGQPLRVLA